MYRIGRGTTVIDVRANVHSTKVAAAAAAA